MSARDQLTDAEIEEIKEIFSFYDQNGNGVIEREEFGSLLRALDDMISDSEVAAGLRALDDNKNGVIDFEEFIEWWADR